MTKKIMCALITTMIVSSASFSQETTKTDSSASGKIKRNEIGINIAPIIAVTLGGFPDSPTFSASFKRVAKEKNALRFSASYHINLDHSSFYNEYYNIVAQTDSMQLRRYRYNQGHNGDRLQVNCGYEWRKGKRKLKYFFGTDLIFGYTNYSYIIFDEIYKLQKGYNFQALIGSDTLYHYVPDNNTPRSTIKSERLDIYYAGASLFIGLIYRLSNKFSLSSQTEIDLSFAYRKKQEDDYVKNRTYLSDNYFFDLNTPGIITDLSLIYLF